MMYDRVWSAPHAMTIRTGDCCAFLVGYGSMEVYYRESEDKALWENLCYLCTASEEQAVIVHTNDKDEGSMEAVLDMCPYARRLVTVPSQMGNYKVTMWIFDKHPEQEVAA
jgi:hypothetical protein